METQYTDFANIRTNLNRLIDEIGNSGTLRRRAGETDESIIAKLIFSAVSRADVQVDGLPDRIIIKKTAAELASFVVPAGYFAYAIDTGDFVGGDGVTAGGNSLGGGGNGVPDIDCASTGNIANLASPGAAIDGVTLTEGLKVLLKDQSTGSENGIYSVQSGALVRNSDFNQSPNWFGGKLFYIKSGTIAKNNIFGTSNSTSFTLGSDSIVFDIVSAPEAADMPYTPATLSDYETVTASDVNSAKKALDRTALLRKSALTEVTDENVHGDTTSGATLYKSTDNNNLYVRLADGSTHRLHPVRETTGVIPGATSDQRLEARVSSPDGGVVHIYYDTSLDQPTWRMFMIPGDGSTRQEVALGVRAIVDTGETYDIEAQDVNNAIGLGEAENYSLITGDSDSKGANGLPIIQGLQLPDAGANPSRQVISGGGDEPVGGNKKLNKRNYRVRGWVGSDRTAFRQNAIKGEHFLYTTDGSTYVALTNAGDWTDSISATADNGGGLVRVTVADTTGLANGDFVYIYGANAEADGAHEISGLTGTTFDLVGSTWSADPGAGSVYSLCHLTQTSAGTNFATL